ncbi:MAG: ribbon-helix-helix domain-containing protein [Salaquimonas sp.]|jgi:predicted DNA-binding ribbon-helix-helix protein|nr:ribbon-helix-helix domain-containing protein [Salaquimonas sp.]
MLKKRSVTIRGHATSYSIEDEFQDALREISRERGRPVAAIIAGIDARRPPGTNLSSAIRIFVLKEASQNAAQP